MQLRNTVVRSAWIFEKAYLPQLKRVGSIFITQHKRVYVQYLLGFLLVRQNTSHRGEISGIHRDLVKAFTFFADVTWHWLVSGSVSCLETSVTKHQPTPPNIPEEIMPHLPQTT